MLRAEAIVSGMSVAIRRKLARRFRADSTEIPDVVAAMRTTKAAEIVLAACKRKLDWEDLALLCANPFDEVAHDEVNDPTLFEEVGLLVLTGEGIFGVNLDLALLLVPYLPLEFGFAATLLARLPKADLATIARVNQVGPRPTRVDYLLDIAESCTSEDRVSQHVAYLSEKERGVLQEAQEMGELPDMTESLSRSMAVPNVTLEQGPAGQRGLVFWFSGEGHDVHTRPVLPLELQTDLGSILSAVPAKPEVTQRKPRRSRGTTSVRQAPSRKTAVSGLNPAITETSERSQYNTLVDPVRSVSTDAFPRARTDDYAAASSPEAIRHAREVRVTRGAAIVSLNSERLANDAQRDPELGPFIEDIIGGTLVVLKEGTWVEDWVERFALRIEGAKS